MREVDYSLMYEPDPGSGLDTYYVFDDLSGMLWPDDYRSNNDVDEKVRKRLMEMWPDAPSAIDRYTHWYYTPVGPVSFDSESGGFNCFSLHPAPVLLVLDILRQMQIEFQLERLRHALRMENISQGELIELASLSDYIGQGDVELLEAAGVSEEEARDQGRI